MEHTTQSRLNGLKSQDMKAILVSAGKPASRLKIGPRTALHAYGARCGVSFIVLKNILMQI